jgi:hypothetical protein
VSLLTPIPKKTHLHTLGHFKHLDAAPHSPHLEDALRLGMYGSNSDNRLESRKLVDDTQDSCKSTGLKEEEGDVRMIEAGQFLRC